MNELLEIQERLRILATPDAVAAYQRVIPTQHHIYGVRTPLLNDLAKEFSRGGFVLVQALWQSAAYEERLIAAKILGRWARKAPDETWRHVLLFAEDLGDWATCDTLAMEGIRGLLAKRGDAVWEAAISFCAREGEWQRRFGLVLLTHFIKNDARRPTLLTVMEWVKSDKRHYVKKAVDWLKRDLAKASTPVRGEGSIIRK